MKKVFLTLLMTGLSLIAGSNALAAVGYDGIDEVNKVQSIDMDTCKVVYVYAHSSAKMKNKNQVEKQQEALDELGKTVVEALKSAFSRTEYKLIEALNEAPTGATVIDAHLVEIDWGSGALRQWVGFGAGNIGGRYTATVTNANGRVCDFSNKRMHDTSLSSAKGAPVIKVYNKALAKDLITVLKGMK